MPKRVLLILFAVIAASLAPLAHALTDEPNGEQLAFCAGVADFEADLALKVGDTDMLDSSVRTAHIFFTLAWQNAGEALPGDLYRNRKEARDELAELATKTDPTSDDDMHTLVQGCSDLQQHLMHQGRFELP